GIGPGIQTQPGTSSPFGQIGTQMGTQTSGAATGVGSSAASPQNPPRTTGTAVSADQGTGVDPNAPIPTGDTPTIMGGNIIGVGSKINKKSVIVYDKAKNYRLFEFIWNPSKDLMNAMGQGTQIGTPAGQNPAGLGQPAGSPATPPQPQPQPTPPPQP